MKCHIIVKGYEPGFGKRGVVTFQKGTLHPIGLKFAGSDYGEVDCEVEFTIGQAKQLRDLLARKIDQHENRSKR